MPATMPSWPTAKERAAFGDVVDAGGAEEVEEGLALEVVGGSEVRLVAGRDVVTGTVVEFGSVVGRPVPGTDTLVMLVSGGRPVSVSVSVTSGGSEVSVRVVGGAVLVVTWA